MLGMGSLGEPQRLSSMTNFSNNSPTVSSGRSISLNQRLTKIKDSRFPLPDTELSRYSLPINSYLNPPNYELSIENFENFSYRRIQLLRFIEKASMQYQDDNDLYREIRVEENRLMPLHSNQSANVKDIFNERFEDEASHFILRLVFSANQEDLRWFCHQETILYRFRLHVLGSEERQEFLAHQMKNHSRISIEEYDRVKSELNCCLATASRESLQKSAVNLSNEICKNIYKIPFEHVPDLVSRRSVYIEKGVAYVPFALCGSFANNRYQAALEYWMNLTAKHVISLKDERVLSIVDALRRSGDESQQALMNSPLFGNLEVVSAKEIDAAVGHFPPCMRNLFEKAVENGHLKYGGRQQLGLFFKSIGLPLEDAVQVWRRLFSSKISSTDEFNKTYLYNIRHNYGQEGKRANYGPTPCNRIILGTAPGLGEYHGCPFRHLGEKKLPELLSKYHGPSGLRPSENQVSEILAIASGGSRCQAACTRLLEVTREMPCTLKESFVTPTQFFEHSVKLSKKKSLRSSHSAVKDEILGTR